MSEASPAAVLAPLTPVAHVEGNNDGGGGSLAAVLGPLTPLAAEGLAPPTPMAHVEGSGGGSLGPLTPAAHIQGIGAGSLSGVLGPLTPIERTGTGGESLGGDDGDDPDDDDADEVEEEEEEDGLDTPATGLDTTSGSGSDPPTAARRRIAAELLGRAKHKYSSSHLSISLQFPNPLQVFQLTSTERRPLWPPARSVASTHRVGSPDPFRQASLRV